MVQTRWVPSSPPLRRVRFDIRPWGRPWGDDPDPERELLPCVNDVSLVDLISGYEHAAGFDVPGAYAGLVLDRFNVGDLTAYLLGRPDSAFWTKVGAILLLGCDCRRGRLLRGLPGQVDVAEVSLGVTLLLADLEPRVRTSRVRLDGQYPVQETGLVGGHEMGREVSELVRCERCERIPAGDVHRRSRFVSGVMCFRRF